MLNVLAPFSGAGSAGFGVGAPYRHELRLVIDQQCAGFSFLKAFCNVRSDSNRWSVVQDERPVL